MVRIVLLTLMVLFNLGCASNQGGGAERKSNAEKRIDYQTLLEKRQGYWSDAVTFNEQYPLIEKNDRRSADKKQNKKSGYKCTKHRKGRVARNKTKVDLDFFDADLREALSELSVLIGVPIVVDDFVEGMVTITLEQTGLEPALRVMLAHGGFSYRIYDDYILVGGSDPESPTFSKLSTTCRYKPLYITPIDLAGSLTPYYQKFVRVPQQADYLTITAPPVIQQQIKENLTIFDTKPGQVLLEMSIVEVSREALEILGVSWSRHRPDGQTGRDRRLGIAEWSGVQNGSSRDLLEAFAVGSMPHRTLASSLQYLEEEGEAQMKAMPAIVSLDGREAEFATTHSVWIPYIGDGGGSGRPKELVYGVDMKVVPRIADNGEVSLRIVNAQVSDLTYGSNGMPHVVSHKVSSSVQIEDGDFLVLGGLFQSKQKESANGVPGFKDKGIGKWFFGQSNKTDMETEVLIMIRPTVIKDRESDEEGTG